MVCVKFKPNFSLKSYFFYLAQSLFKSSFIQFSISYSILFKYYFFIHFLLLFSTKLKPNRDTQKNAQQLHQSFTTKPSNFSQKTQQIYKLSQQYYRKLSINLQTFTAVLQKIIKTRTTPANLQTSPTSVSSWGLFTAAGCFSLSPTTHFSVLPSHKSNPQQNHNPQWIIFSLLIIKCSRKFQRRLSAYLHFGHG